VSEHYDIDLTTHIGPLQLSSPVMTASGTFGYGEEYASMLDIDSLGAVVTKGVSLVPSPGNPPPRIVETPAGMLNAIGLQNIGVDALITEKIPFLLQFSAKIIVNFYGNTDDQYLQLARRLDAVDGVDALEANISCPNIKQGGITFGKDPLMAHRLVAQIRSATQRPLIVKLSPNVTDITAIASAVEEAGADALSLINTFTGMAVDIETRRPALANVTGGLSGPAIRPIALRMVWETVQAVSVPVIGIGGIMNAEDALSFLIVGARAVQVGTGLFVNPRAPVDIGRGIAAYLHKHGLRNPDEIIGSLDTGDS
jgi:dihydroorotate dehydrogenase (NAD+) catalytic subunit